MIYAQDLLTPADAPRFAYAEAAAAEAALEALAHATPAERAEALKALHALAVGEPCAHPFFEGYTPADAQAAYAQAAAAEAALVALDMLEAY